MFFFVLEVTLEQQHTVKSYVLMCAISWKLQQQRCWNEFRFFFLCRAQLCLPAPFSARKSSSVGVIDEIIITNTRVHVLEIDFQLNSRMIVNSFENNWRAQLAWWKIAWIRGKLAIYCRSFPCKVYALARGELKILRWKCREYLRLCSRVKCVSYAGNWWHSSWPCSGRAT